MLGMEESKVFTDVRGTIGYMDPEYMTNAKLTSASDIYSFGIVALQLLSGQKVIELDLDASEQLMRKVLIFPPLNSSCLISKKYITPCVINQLEFFPVGKGCELGKSSINRF